MPCAIPWYTLIDDFDADFGVDQRHGTKCLHPGQRRDLQTPPYQWWNYHAAYDDDS
jgi:hypothetical protein